MHDIRSPSGEGTFEYGLHLIVDGIRTALPIRAITGSSPRSP